MTLRATLLLLALGLSALCTGANEQSQPDCLACHTATADVAVHAVFHTVHGALDGGGAAACSACHGASEAHARRPTDAAPQVSFGPRWQAEAEARDGACLGCHAGGSALHWAGSEHQQEGLDCASCHRSHRQQDPALNESESQAVCVSCHSRVRAELLLPSRHPIAEGKTACGDCHNPHGALTGASLREPSLNEQCFTCHQDKRGPFLWEHPPAAEDCGLCHRPHGAVHDRLLTVRGPALCQQCHAAAFHPSLPYGSEGLAGGGANRNLLGKNCLNCHSRIHGSNHPSGARLAR
ncbi:DmsE family decaheme c-type cytochrome [Kineobactrum salinum]|uniref:DmsE family decaheme c-type cytochrome n=1 Tax=Kineobactrum salinum TaxID=2708301 RepID=A0A6C0U2I5_9GAMM|nr:DmsE family decaheme c-type cytochrome [Kineobactrum salinum]QIB66370.1 DmsE family decaheme c-type cytochrome [Kineobactrum salinum]